MSGIISCFCFCFLYWIRWSGLRCIYCLSWDGHSLHSFLFLGSREQISLAFTIYYRMDFDILFGEFKACHSHFSTRKLSKYNVCPERRSKILNVVATYFLSCVRRSESWAEAMFLISCPLLLLGFIRDLDYGKQVIRAFNIHLYIVQFPTDLEDTRFGPQVFTHLLTS
jgi:hypothetical protein